MEGDLQSALTQSLRGLHDPESISWWPLAIGWWVLIILAISLMTWTIAILRKRYKDNRYRKISERKIGQYYEDWKQTGDISKYLANSNQLLRRILTKLELVQETASSSSEIWIQSLQNLSKNTLSMEVERALTVECYRPTPQVDIDQLHLELLNWVQNHRTARISNAR